ncbi:MAG: transcription elongation factor GreA [Erysipelothrix sp.]|nr:transcription elongation factor GreA [Erysipelothrix sp.]
MAKDSQKVAVTKDGLNELLKEQKYLIHTVRAEVKEELQAAREQGDLSENADYDAARDRQAKVEARIRELDNMLSNIELIDETTTGRSKRVQLGSTVTIQELDTNEEATYIIVGSVESDPANGKLSNSSPLALAMMDRKANDIVDVKAHLSYQVKILSIK